MIPPARVPAPVTPAAHPLLGADLGEHEDPAVTAALLPLLDLAHVACGGHAGTPESIARWSRLGREHGVRVGLHPGLPDGDGRQLRPLSPARFRHLLETGLDTFRAAAEAPGHLKLHGALYHLTEREPVLAAALLDFAAAHGLPVVCLAGGRVAAAARARGLPHFAEAFLDRGYAADASLIPRGQPGALVADPALLVDRLQRLRAGRPWPGAAGGEFPVAADLLCIHADSPRALELAQLARGHLDRAHPRPSKS